MDCICTLKQPCLGVSISSPSCFYLLTSESLIELDIHTLHVKTRIKTTQIYPHDRYYSIELYQSNLYIFSNTPEYQVYNTDPPEYIQSVLCSGKKPYIPCSALIANDLVIFSTFSHSNLYFFSLSGLNSTGVVKRPVKLKLPAKVLLTRVVIQPEGVLLLGACTDGLIRVWNIDTKEELCPLYNTGDGKINKKNIAKMVKKGATAINCIEFNGEGTEVACGDDKGLVTLWDIKDINNSKVLLTNRLSETGIIDICLYSNSSKYLVLIKEGRVLLLETSPKVKHSNVFCIPNPSLPRICKSLYVFPSGHIVLTWPGTSDKTLYLLSSLNTNPSKPLAQLPAQSMQSLIPSPVSYPVYFYYLSDSSITSYSILDSTSKIILQVPHANTFMVRPMNNPLLILLSTDQGIILWKLDKNTKIEISGHAGVFTGGDFEIPEVLIVLGEDRNSIILYNIASEHSQSFNVPIKIKNIFWSPNNYGITYQTLHEHSVRLSQGFNSKVLADIELDLSFRLEYDEYLISADWNINGKSLALSTSKRIIILNQTLALIRNFSLLGSPLSVFWFGCTLICSKEDGIYYCGDTFKLIFHTFSPSLICGVLDDRVFLLADHKIKAFPVNMAEPLLWGCIENSIKPEEINKIVRLMGTTCVSEDIVSKLLLNDFPQAAWYLAEKSFISLDLKIEILKQLKMFEQIEKLLLRGKDITDPIESRNFLEELHSDHNWKLERSLFPKVAEFLDSCGQLKKEAEFLKTSKKYWDLSILHLSVGNLYPLSDSLVAPEPLLEDIHIEPLPTLPSLDLAYGEFAYRQLVDSQDILVAYSENLSHWFGWEALKRPEKFMPQYMDQGVSLKQEVEEEEELHENESEGLYLYLRCDEGKGDTISDVLSSKLIRINENQWAGVLEEGEPLDYDDKWGKQAQPSHRVLMNKDSYIIIEDIKVPKSWSLEFWVTIADSNCTIFTLGTFIFQINYNKFRFVNSMIELQMKPESSYRDINKDTWEHICIAAKDANLFFYLGSNLIATGKVGNIDGKTSVILGGFLGSITEIRLWKYCRNSQEIKDNYKCPLEILSEKRKKKWVNIKINKNDKINAENSVLAPAAKGLKLLLPDTRPKVEFKPLKPPVLKKLTPVALTQLKSPVKEKDNIES